MGSIIRLHSKAKGHITWYVSFTKKRNYVEVDRFSATFSTKGLAVAFCNKWELIFNKEGSSAVVYDRAAERIKRQRFIREGGSGDD